MATPFSASGSLFPVCCWVCGETSGIFSPLEPVRCPQCGTPMALQPRPRPVPEMFQTFPRSMWDYAPLLPVRDPTCIITLGEGATPLIEAPRLTRRLGFTEVRIKNESANPTGSFKDRQVSVGLTCAREAGYRTAAVVSSGNVGVAAAAYCARAGMRAVLFMHAHAGTGKIAQAAACGARVFLVDCASPNRVFALCREACATFGWAHLSTAGMDVPANVEGARTIAYELWQQYGGNLPDWIVAPVGGGGLLGGLWRGLMDLKQAGLISQFPRLAGVQAAGCAPLARAQAENWTPLEALSRPWPNPQTIAGGIADDILFDAHTVLPGLRATDGMAITVSDEAIREAAFALAREEGLLAEPTAAVVFAALRDLPRSAGTRVCCLLTGHGLKDLPFYTSAAEPPVTIPPDFAALETVWNALGLC